MSQVDQQEANRRSTEAGSGESHKNEKSQALPDIFASLHGLRIIRRLYFRHVVAQNDLSFETHFAE